MLSDERRREIADFLKTRRMRRQPEELGLPRGRRRRTPGLRREEVAAAAGVSAEWYTWLEQAREVRPSAQVLTRIGAALRLEPNETRHLLTLGGYAVPASGSDLPAVRVGEPPAPAADRSDGLRSRLGVRRAVGHRGLEPRRVGHPRRPRRASRESSATRCTSSSWATGCGPMLVDWEAHGRQCVAKLRATYASRVDDPWFNELVTLLRTRSEQFERWWNENDIETSQEGVKHYEHPEAGRLVFDLHRPGRAGRADVVAPAGGLRAGAGHRHAGEDGKAAQCAGAAAGWIAGGLTANANFDG